MIAAEPTQRRRIPAWLPQVLGYTVSAACLAWVLHGYDFHQLASDFRTLDWRWVGLAVIADLVVYVCHGWRWQTLLAPVAQLSFWRTVQSIYIGLFANEVLPLRPGEVIRCYLLAYWNDMRFSVGLASAALERVIDGIWLLVAFILTAAFARGMPREIEFAGEAMGVGLLVAVVLFAWVLRHHHHAHAVFKESRWSAVVRHIIEGLQLMGNRRTLALTSLISVVYFALQVVTMWALMKAYALDYSILVAGGVLAIVRLGTLVPNAPGNVGLVNASVVVALRLFESSEGDAKGFSLVYLVAQTLPLLIGGAIATALTGLNIGELRDHARARAAQHARRGAA
ncbi:MAG: flippase-like domain-containing protein [Acidobacteria bacterium]|nr:flippase-like domain-containing protein [Acidobacteriota bacterium]